MQFQITCSHCHRRYAIVAQPGQTVRCACPYCKQQATVATPLGPNQPTAWQDNGSTAAPRHVEPYDVHTPTPQPRVQERPEPQPSAASQSHLRRRTTVAFIIVLILVILAAMTLYILFTMMTN